MADDSRNNQQHTIGSYAAIGDSFTEGVGDPGPDGAFVGWADRFAVLLADRLPAPETSAGPDDSPHGNFRYANLAVRGRLLDQIVAEQVPRAKELAPDLVSFCAGGNDIIRPGTDPDDLAERYERAVAELSEAVARSWSPPASTPGRPGPAPHARQDRHVQRPPAGHRRPLPVPGARPVVAALRPGPARLGRRPAAPVARGPHPRRPARRPGPRHQVPADPDQPWPPQAQRTPYDTRRDNIQWAREYLVPWIGRRLRGESSGDHVEAKRPDLLPL